MKTFEELWNLLTSQDESSSIEVKKGSHIDKSCWETICAFSNETGLGGGYLILGIADLSRISIGKYEVIGLDDPDKIQRDLSSVCNNGTFNIALRPRISLETIEGKTVIIAYIPEVDSRDKPVYIQKRGLPRGAFRRSGSADIRCNDDDIARFYQERQNQSYDKMLWEESTLDDLDTQAIQRYRELRKEVNPNAAELNESDQELLHSISAITKDRENNTFYPTVAGLILFGKSTALRRYFPAHRIDYMIIEGNEWVENPDKRYTSVNEIREPLLLAIPKISNLVLNDLPKAFHLPEQDLQRKDIPLIPSKVIREAIVNAVMHRNYKTRSPIQIIRYSDRLEIHNAGYSLKPTTDIEESRSYLRNEAIAATLHELDIAETKGTGWRTIIKLMLDANLSLPKLDSRREEDRFCLTLRTHHLVGQEDRDWLKQFKAHNLSDEEAKAMIVLKKNGSLNNFVYRITNNVDTLTASRALGRLVKKDILQSHGKGSATSYTLTSSFSVTDEHDACHLESSTSHEVLSGESVVLNLESSTSHEVLSGESVVLNLESSTSHEVLSGENVVLNPESSASEPTQLSMNLFPDELPNKLRERLTKLSRRAQPQEIRRLIIDLCGLKAWSSSELAKHLGRNQKYLTEQYLKPLLDEELIIYTNPDNPNDPFQTYKTPDDETEI